MAYATLAPFYDRYAAGYGHDVWIDRLHALCCAHGLRGNRALDAACGTGLSLAPLIRLGYDAAGCDVSPEMLRCAEQRVPGVQLHLADLRAMPHLGDHDLVTCLDDALNYLLDETDLEHALAGLADQLRAGGILVFDVNSLSAHRESYQSCWVVEQNSVFFCWVGHGCEQSIGEPGYADLEIFACNGELWTRATSTHRQRWWSPAAVAAAAERAGLQLLDCYGQRVGALIEPSGNDLAHDKLVYFLRRRTERR